jgi:hypothetical protein
MKTQLKQNQIPKIKNQSYYFTNGGSGVDLSNLVLIYEKKKICLRESLRKERELEKRELQRGRERDRKERGYYWF